MKPAISFLIPVLDEEVPREEPPGCIGAVVLPRTQAAGSFAVILGAPTDRAAR